MPSGLSAVSIWVSDRYLTLACPSLNPCYLHSPNPTKSCFLSSLPLLVNNIFTFPVTQAKVNKHLGFFLDFFISFPEFSQSANPFGSTFKFCADSDNSHDFYQYCPCHLSLCHHHFPPSPALISSLTSFSTSLKVKAKFSQSLA